MKHYYKNQPTTASVASPTPTGTKSTTNHPPTNDSSILSKFDRHRLAFRQSQEEDEEWQAELRRYLKELPSDVTKDTDAVEWWQVTTS
jgi:hypothetical protein